MNPKYHMPLLAALAALLFLSNLGGYDLWPPDEPRFAQVAREMLTTGDYLVPRMNGQPYTEKPPMLFWAAAALSYPIGDVTELTARLPLALAGIATVLLTYVLARSLYDPRVAFWAALILITNQRFWWQARFGQIDMLLTLFTTASLLCFWQWHRYRDARWLAGFYLAIAAAVLTKGPPGLVFPLFLAVVFYWKQKPDRKALHLFWGIAFVALVAAAWMIPARMSISVESGVGASEGIASNMFRQTIGRFFLGISHAKWPWFYATHMPTDLLPWALFLPWTLYWVWKKRAEGKEMRFLLSWIIPAFLFFSACIGKRSIYLLPLYPALAILIARSTLDLMAGPHAVWRKRAAALWGAGLLAAALVPLVLPFTEYKEAWHTSLILLCVGAGACAIHAFYTAVRTDGSQLARAMAIHFSLVAFLCGVLLFPAVDPYKSARGYCAPLRALTDNNVPYDLYSVGFSKEEYVYYANHFHEPVLCDLLDIESMKDLPDYEQARLQSKLKRAIQKAVADVPLASASAITDEEVLALKQAIEDYFKTDHDGMSEIATYETAVSAQLARVLTCTDGLQPTFLMVLEEDWRWIVVLNPEARQLIALKNTSVGSRDVLLFANQAGVDALAQRDAGKLSFVAPGKIEVAAGDTPN